MAGAREVHVHLLPELVPPGRLSGGLAVVIDVLRATTTMVHALAAGCTIIRPCAEVAEARSLAAAMRPEQVLLGGERGGIKLPGFDLGNSPGEYTPERCRGRTLVLTTTNGTRALLRAAEAGRVLVASFVNLSAVCEHLVQDRRPLHIVCAGSEHEVTLDDTLLAGALVEFLCQRGKAKLNDSARLALACWVHYDRCALDGLDISQGGTHLRSLGYDEDIRAAALVDRFALVPELRHDPLRVETGSAGPNKSHRVK